jgi:hypothetical protein
MSMLYEVAARLRSLFERRQVLPLGADLAGDEWREMPRFLPGAGPAPLAAIPRKPTEEQEWAARLALAKSDGDRRTNQPTAIPDEEWTGGSDARRRDAAAFARKVDQVASHTARPPAVPPPIPRDRARQP